MGSPHQEPHPDSEQRRSQDQSEQWINTDETEKDEKLLLVSASSYGLADGPGVKIGSKSHNKIRVCEQTSELL